jgi:hypothetical protein
VNRILTQGNGTRGFLSRLAVGCAPALYSRPVIPAARKRIGLMLCRAYKRRVCLREVVKAASEGGDRRCSPGPLSQLFKFVESFTNQKENAMKALFLSLLLIGSAHAGTVALEPSPCSSTYYCQNVANSAGESIAVITYSQHYGRLSAMIDGVLWDSGLWALLGQGTTLVNVPLYNGSEVIYMSIDFTGGQITGPCAREGRVTVCPRAPVYIVSGSIATP